MRPNPVDPTSFFEKGWCRFDRDQALTRWIEHALPAARAAVTAPANAGWLRCGGTWFAGVNALTNDAKGVTEDGWPLRGTATDFIRRELEFGNFDWDRAQVSVCYPGYPRPMASEPPAAFRYRREQDAAHVDGLLPEGPNRRRHLREHHRFILGIPMVEYGSNASPFVVWEGSHEIIRSVLSERFLGLPSERWGDEDVTEVYHQARRRVFEECARVEIAARAGEAYIAHRLTVHGVAPWGGAAHAGSDGRMICYFRPESGDPLAWLNAP